MYRRLTFSAIKYFNFFSIFQSESLSAPVSTSTMSKIRHGKKDRLRKSGTVDESGMFPLTVGGSREKLLSLLIKEARRLTHRNPQCDLIAQKCSIDSSVDEQFLQIPRSNSSFPPTAASTSSSTSSAFSSLTSTLAGATGSSAKLSTKMLPRGLRLTTEGKDFQKCVYLSDSENESGSDSDVEKQDDDYDEDNSDGSEEEKEIEDENSRSSDDDDIDDDDSNENDDDDNDDDDDDDDNDDDDDDETSRKGKKVKRNSSHSMSTKSQPPSPCSTPSLPLSPVDIVLRSTFGYTTFRPGQRSVWGHILT